MAPSPVGMEGSRRGLVSTWLRTLPRITSSSCTWFGPHRHNFLEYTYKNAWSVLNAPVPWSPGSGNGGLAPLLLSHVRLARVVEPVLHSVRLFLPAELSFQGSFNISRYPRRSRALFLFNQKFSPGCSRSSVRRGQSRAIVVDRLCNDCPQT